MSVPEKRSVGLSGERVWQDLLDVHLSTIDAVTEAFAQGYERGRSIEAARAESRAALGLPIKRGAE